MWVGSASAADHVRRDGRVGRGVAGPGVAARPGAGAALVAPRRRPPGRWSAGGVGGRGLHWLALRGRGDRGGWVRGARGRAGRHASSTRAQAPGQDRPSDARPLRELLQRGELPESRIAPAVVLDWRERVRLYKSLVDQRGVWIQRIHAELFQHGVAIPEAQIRTASTREWLTSDAVALTAAALQRISTGHAMITATDAEALPLKEQLTRFGMRQRACRALANSQYGIGGLLAVAVWSELGDCRRFSCSEQAVRHTGLDVVVDASDLRRAGGYQSRQGPATLRWALFEAPHHASRASRPDHAYYTAVNNLTTASSQRSPSPASSTAAATTSCATSTPTSSTASPS